jgi:hypothetical protein
VPTCAPYSIEQPDRPALLELREALAEFAAFADSLPFLAEMAAHLQHDAATTIGWCDDQQEFEFGLDALLDGLELRRTAPR